MLEFIQAIISGAEAIVAFVAPFWPWVKAILLALLFSWGITQFIKYVWRVIKSLKSLRSYKVNEDLEVLVFRSVASLTCFVPLYHMWPDVDDAFWWAITLALLSPLLYKLFTKWAYKRWPFLETWLSATPAIVVKRDKYGQIIGIKEGDDKTQIIRPDDTTERLNRD